MGGALAVALGLAGCGGEAAARGSGSASITLTATLSDGGGTQTGTDGDGTDGPDTGPADDPGAATGGAASGNTPKFDLGLQPDTNLEMDDGCTKVDFLFVIDNSGSMGDNQANLVANFPNFIDGIQSTLANVDEYQVGVVTSDGYGPNVDGCDQLGGLVVETGGSDSSNATCGPYAAGGNFMTEADDLPTKFACAARVGTNGSAGERPMNALEAVVDRDLGGPGECNEGFLRDDALLVIVIITDEWDGPGDPDPQHSSGDADSWYDTVVAAKAGIPENVVVLSLVHFGGCPPSDGFMSGDIEPFTQLFMENGFVGCIADDYAAIFSEATGIIEDACNNFQPPG